MNRPPRIPRDARVRPLRIIEFALMAAGKIQVAQEHIARIPPRGIITLVRERIAALTPVPAIAVIVLIIRSYGLCAKTAPQRQRPLRRARGCHVWLAPIVVAWIGAVTHGGALPRSSPSATMRVDDENRRLARESIIG